MCSLGPCRGAGSVCTYLDAILSWELLSEAGAELGLGFQAVQLSRQAREGGGGQDGEGEGL